MFKKPLQVKGNTSLRNSDRRKIFSRLHEGISKSLSSENKFAVQKIQTSLKLVNIYEGDKCPLFFDLDGSSFLYPTVYTVWRCPAAYPVLIVNAFTFDKLENGADLMSPGVINNSDAFPKFSVGCPVAIAVLSEDEIKGPMAIGRALLSSDEMVSNGMKGKCVQILHCYRDYLWESGDKQKVPTFSHDQFFRLITFLPSGNKVLENEKDDTISISEDDHQEISESKDVAELKENERSSATEMEHLLRQTFLAAVRYKVDGNCQFPIDAGQFYANFVLKNLPTNCRIDLKKTKYKKFSNFLHYINDDCPNDGKLENWIVKIITKKGIDTIEKVNFEHPSVKCAEFLHSDSDSNDVQKSNCIRVAECFSVTEAVAPFFRQFSTEKQIRRGDILQLNKIRDLLIEYSKSHNLDRDAKKLELDDTLQPIVKHFVPVVLPVNDVVQKICAQMTKCYVISGNEGTRQKVYKGRLPLIEMKVEKRSGNKVVTLLNNLSSYGIDEKPLCQRIQSAMATGTSVTPTAPNCDGPQVLVHGNMVNFIGEELINVYGLQKKYIKGLELGIKEKKKKK